MRVLIIGGTLFLGRHIVATALERGHDVTLFHRGETGRDLFPDVDRVIGDRSLPLDDPRSLAALGRRRFDAVVDPSAYVPRDVVLAATVLAGRAEWYGLVSTVSVYDESVEHIDESSAVRVLPPEASRTARSDEFYGELKALCESEAFERFGATRAHVVRPGLIVGPHDPTDRFTYWPARVALGGEILLPGRPSDPVQFVDVRDVASFVVRSFETRRHGIDNVTSPRGRFTLAEVISSATDLARSEATFTWVAPGFLARHGLAMWSDLPVWAPPARSVWDVDTSRAIAAGLPTRDLDDTVAATLAWHVSRGAVRLAAGLSPERERAALAAWHRERASRCGAAPSVAE